MTTKAKTIVALQELSEHIVRQMHFFQIFVTHWSDETWTFTVYYKHVDEACILLADYDVEHFVKQISSNRFSHKEIQFDSHPKARAYVNSEIERINLEEDICI